MFYGFDMGGSKIELGVFDAKLQRIWQKRVATPRDDYRQLLATLRDMTLEADAVCGAPGQVGIGIPGLPNDDDGTLFTANVPAAMGQPLPRDLAALIGREVRVENDANCFALSEAWDEEFRRYPVVFGLILGTGVGGGLIVDGKVVSGRNHIAGEFGHLRLPVDALEVLGRDIPRVACGCGHHGCIENYISGRGFEWLYAHFYQQRLSAPQIIAHYQAGEPQAQAHVERFLDLLAICLGNLLTVIDPHLVVIGGGLSNFAAIYQALPSRLPRSLLRVAKMPRIEPARYGDAGGVRGAAFLNLVDN
ncbi:N-acetyl-D-glucosamine kinase [Serratia rubidaea]|uniref:N-acetyl-D-glucosamine kinase n=1 Tax=Serratia rubidaea TaxID=61652 RepID=A0A447QT16_SERRU|nr:MULTISPECIES: N-acetylglucosamine kinase [Serratia]AGB82137.1 transcriptional regulator/sugar kinase [Serratia sp. FGI94]AML58983.1 N-acetyl-D-glucosamine kinase [Serratia rubidaea]MDC6111237.1 N-acetylglucosamine kinase [Serratia rubidaea]MDK1703568.1 N-acetylglucosamine kinase [Serratia rubidaea]QPR62362.1 N-acetylglucosamine kinase [Serratia rubidaea]